MSCWYWRLSIHFRINFDNVGVSQFVLVLGANEMDFRSTGFGEERSSGSFSYCTFQFAGKLEQRTASLLHLLLFMQFN